MPLKIFTNLTNGLWLAITEPRSCYKNSPVHSLFSHQPGTASVPGWRDLQDAVRGEKFRHMWVGPSRDLQGIRGIMELIQKHQAL